MCQCPHLECMSTSKRRHPYSLTCCSCVTGCYLTTSTSGPTSLRCMPSAKPKNAPFGKRDERERESPVFLSNSCALAYPRLVGASCCPSTLNNFTRTIYAGQWSRVQDAVARLYFASALLISDWLSWPNILHSHLHINLPTRNQLTYQKV